MASKAEVNKAVLKILDGNPLLRFDAEKIQGFVDLLAEKLKYYPGWLMDEAADRFITTEIDFPRFNIASILNYCYQVRDDKTAVLRNKFQSIKDNWYSGEPCKREDMVKLAADFVLVGAMEWANSVRESTDTYTRKPEKTTPERMKKVDQKIRQILSSWTEGK